MRFQQILHLNKAKLYIGHVNEDNYITFHKSDVKYEVFLSTKLVKVYIYSKKNTSLCLQSTDRSRFKYLLLINNIVKTNHLMLVKYLYKFIVNLVSLSMMFRCGIH